jgi:hypothetical protein
MAARARKTASRARKVLKGAKKARAFRRKHLKIAKFPGRLAI